MLNKPIDNFSAGADKYAIYRPVYPDELYRFIYQYVPGFSSAWDCATGNGQVATQLATRFKTVYATDISKEQLANAKQAANIIYSQQRAEETSFSNHSFDLITVAQALHWFNFDAFNTEVKRLLKPKGVLAVWLYDVLTIEPTIDSLFQNFYHHTIGPYWDAERSHIDNHYNSIPFPFTEIACPLFHIEVNWTLADFEGYLNTWSGVKKYIAANGINPVDSFIFDIGKLWPAGTLKKVIFPLYLKLGMAN